MSTKNPRVNVTFDEQTINLISELASKKDQSISSLIRELTIQALEMQEDIYLSNIAKTRDIEGKTTYYHEKAWQ